MGTGIFDPLSTDAMCATIAREFLDQDSQPLTGLAEFAGCGIYALYYSGPFKEYANLGRRPLYLGKASPASGRDGSDPDPRATRLWSRLMRHRASLEVCINLDVDDLQVRYLLLGERDINLAERGLIQHFKPIWNIMLKGFGNQPVGKTRITSKMSAWDQVHPGRAGIGLGGTALTTLREKLLAEAA